MNLNKRTFIRTFISIDEWSQMTEKQQHKKLSLIDDEGLDMNSYAYLQHSIVLNKLSNYKDILKCANVLDIVEKTKDAWFHAKTQIELIDVDKDITNYNLKKKWKQHLNLINKNIKMWENISQLTEDNIPSKKYLLQYPFSSVINSGTLTYLGKSIKVTVLKLTEYMHPFLRIEEYITKRGYEIISRMVANYLLVDLKNEDNDIEKENKLLSNLIEQTNNTITSYYKMHINKSKYKIYFDIESIETMYNIIIKCNQLGFHCEPDYFCSLD
jgi:hypothetical protein